MSVFGTDFRRGGDLLVHVRTHRNKYGAHRAHPKAVSQTGSYEVRVEGRRSRFFYWGDMPGRRMRLEQMTGAQALELAKLLARGLSKTR